MDSAVRAVPFPRARRHQVGYVTDFVGEGHSHYGQYIGRHHRRVIEKAAQYGIMLDVTSRFTIPASVAPTPT